MTDRGRRRIAMIAVLWGTAVSPVAAEVHRVDDVAHQLPQGTLTQVRLARTDKPEQEWLRVFHERDSDDLDDTLMLVQMFDGGVTNTTLLFPTMVLSLDFQPGDTVGIGWHQSLSPAESIAAAHRLRTLG